MKTIEETERSIQLWKLPIISEEGGHIQVVGWWMEERVSESFEELDHLGVFGWRQQSRQEVEVSSL